MRRKADRKMMYGGNIRISFAETSSEHIRMRNSGEKTDNTGHRMAPNVRKYRNAYYYMKLEGEPVYAGIKRN